MLFLVGLLEIRDFVEFLGDNLLQIGFHPGLNDHLVDFLHLLLFGLFVDQFEQGAPLFFGLGKGGFDVLENGLAGLLQEEFLDVRGGILANFINLGEDFQRGRADLLAGVFQSPDANFENKPQVVLIYNFVIVDELLQDLDFNC